MAKKATRSSLIADYKFLGREPEYTDRQMGLSEQIKALNWYNYFKTSDDAKQYIQDYCASKKIKISISNHTQSTYGWLARMISQGANLPESQINKLNAYIETLKKPTITGKSATIITVDEFQTRKVSIWLEDFEEMIDHPEAGFNPYAYLTAKAVPQMYVKQIAEFYQPQLEEVEAAYNKTDKELTQSYSYMSRSQLKEHLERLQLIIEDCNKFLGNTKKVRKPRTKKTKSIDSLLKYFKYQKTDDKLKITSEDPFKLIGASAIYAINTKYNTLTVFFAKDDKGLTVKRTSISGYNPKTSKTKRVGRKLQEVIKMITEGTKASRKRIMENIKTEDIRFTDRISETVIILKVDK